MRLTQTGCPVLIDVVMDISTEVLDALVDRDGITDVFVIGEVKGGVMHITFNDPDEGKDDESVLHGAFTIIRTPSWLVPLVFSRFTARR